jgi:hypothetical protein
MSDTAREWAERARKAQEAVNALGAGPPASRLADDDQELAARARQLAEDGVRSAEAQALARELLRQLAGPARRPGPGRGGERWLRMDRASA